MSNQPSTRKKKSAKKSRRKVGRPRPEAEKFDRFVEGTALGLTRKLAAQYAGFSLTTAEKYLTAGKEGDPQYTKFAAAVMEAEASGAAVNLKLIMKHAKKDWRAAAWVLNNRHGDEYKSKQVVAGDPDAPLGVREVLLPARRKDDE